jgi:hypothetical protein
LNVRWLLFPNSNVPANCGSKREHQRLRNQKHDALKNYQLNEGNTLYRKLDSAIDSPEKVVPAGDVFNSIKKVYIELVHAGIKKR